MAFPRSALLSALLLALSGCSGDGHVGRNADTAQTHAALVSQLERDLEPRFGARLDAPGVHAFLSHFAEGLLADPTAKAAILARGFGSPHPPMHAMGLTAGSFVRDVAFGESAPWFHFAVTPGDSYRISTDQLSASCTAIGLSTADQADCQQAVDAGGPDTVVHVFAPDPAKPGLGTEIAVNDDCSSAPVGFPHASCASFSAGVSSTIAVAVHTGPLFDGLPRTSGRLLLHDATTGTEQSANFEMAGNLMIDLSAMPSGSPLRSGHRAVARSRQQGERRPRRGRYRDLAAWTAACTSWAATRTERGAGAAARVVHAESAGAAWAMVRPWSFWKASDVLEPLVPAALSPRADGTKARDVGPGRYRAALDDWYDEDSDHDGLSDAIESELGLCDGLVASVPSSSPGVGFPCSTWSEVVAGTNTNDPRDTDGDGISDYAEVLGSDRGGSSSDADQTFPLVGRGSASQGSVRRSRQLREKLSGCERSQPRCAAPGASDRHVPAWSARAGRSVPLRGDLRRYPGGRGREPGRPCGHCCALRRGARRSRCGLLVPRRATSGTGAAPAQSYYVRDFSPVSTDGSYPARSGLVIYDPDGSGSACSDTPAQTALSNAHKGAFAHYALKAYSAREGNSAFASLAGWAGLDGGTFAHEMGHFLGLDHGGPGGASPFAAPAGDRYSVTKINQFSVMNYVYQGGGNVDVGFSSGERALYPLPRPGSLDYPEQKPFGPLSADFLAADSLGAGSWGFFVFPGRRRLRFRRERRRSAGRAGRSGRRAPAAATTATRRASPTSRGTSTTSTPHPARSSCIRPTRRVRPPRPWRQARSRPSTSRITTTRSRPATSGLGALSVLRVRSIGPSAAVSVRRALLELCVVRRRPRTRLRS